MTFRAVAQSGPESTVAAERLTWQHVEWCLSQYSVCLQYHSNVYFPNTPLKSNQRRVCVCVLAVSVFVGLIYSNPAQTGRVVAGSPQMKRTNVCCRDVAPDLPLTQLAWTGT